MSQSDGASPDVRGGSGGTGGTGGSGGTGGAATGGTGGAEATGGTGGTAGMGGTGGTGGTGGAGGTDATGGSAGSGGAGGTGGTGGSAGSGGAGGSTMMDAAPPIDRMADLPPDLPPPPPDMAPASTLNLGLVGRWKLDEGSGNTAADSAGGNNNGTITGATWVTAGYPNAKYANPAALRFDGNDHVQMTPAGLPANNRPQTITLWLNYGSVPGSNAQLAVSLTDGQSGGTRLKIGFKEGRLGAIKGGSNPNLVLADPPAPGWHHLAYTFDGTTNRVYIDGTVRAMSTTAPDNGPASIARMGGNYDGSEPFTGTLDEVRIYDRALSAAEVAMLAAGNE